jgi:hypothetical protein
MLGAFVFAVGTSVSHSILQADEASDKEDGEASDLEEDFHLLGQVGVDHHSTCIAAILCAMMTLQECLLIGTDPYYTVDISVHGRHS